MTKKILIAGVAAAALGATVAIAQNQPTTTSTAGAMDQNAPATTATPGAADTTTTSGAGSADNNAPTSGAGNYQAAGERG